MQGGGWRGGGEQGSLEWRLEMVALPQGVYWAGTNEIVARLVGAKSAFVQA